MSGTRARINIYAPTVNRFPEFNAIGGYRLQHHDLNRTNLPLLAGIKTDSSAVAEVTAAVLEDDELGMEGSGRSLYVRDSQGRLLEHVRYQGNDYRSALRAAVSTKPNHWRE